jgi:hypothetical protein
VIPDNFEYSSNNYGFGNINDWRRNNVNMFIKELHDTIEAVKPWVKFGVSPFGIYRNKKNDPARGSMTNGLQNYDDLYADILLWVEKGWIDYCVPQIYWEIGNKAADYKTLINWWTANCTNRPLFIGEDIERTVKFNQQDIKHQLHTSLLGHKSPLQGTVLWYAKAAVDNVGGYGTNLRNIYWRYPALQPLMPFKYGDKPGKVRKVKPIWTSDGYVLFWEAPKSRNYKNIANKYVVYCFKKGESINIEDPSHIVAITPNTWYNLPYVNGKEKFVYVVTALDRMSNESAHVKKNVKL